MKKRPMTPYQRPIENVNTSCAFTGHRPSKLPWKSDETSTLFYRYRRTLETEVATLAEKGVVNYFSGMAEGTDLVCAEVVLFLRETNPAIKLHCAVPFIGHEEKWSTFSRERYQEILSKADSIIYVNRNYTPNCYLARNRFMVDYSSVLLATYDGSSRSGTGMTVRYARKLGRELFVIHPKSLGVTHEIQDCKDDN